jgi:protoporphyrinogen/coproporphyrinogen III oxidase
LTTAVIGGGLAGLVRAHTLGLRGEPVLLFEASREPGGVVRTERRDGYLLELGPNSVRPTPELWGLVEALGLGGEALVADPRTPRFVDYGGRLHRVPTSPAGIVGTSLLSWRGKLRFLGEPFASRGRVRGESVAAFFSRRLGPEAVERLIEPFVSGIWGGRADSLSIADSFPMLAQWEAERGSIIRGALASKRAGRKAGPRPPRGLLSFREGLATLPRRLSEAIGPRVRFESRVDSLAPSGDAWRIAAAGRDTDVARVFVATPARDAARLVESFAFEAASALRAIPYAPLVVLHVSAPAPDRLRGFGHLVVPTADRRILGAIWSSCLFAGRAPAGRALFTVFLGGARDPAALDLADGALADAAGRDLAAVGLPRSLEVVRVTRYPAAIPQYDLGHASRIETIERAERANPGLFFLGSYRGGVSVGDVVRSALSLPD